jgi:hypothetical protein
MSQFLLVGTRKGLFTITKNNGRWSITDKAFVGVPVTIVFRQPATGELFAALDHGHFGVKLHRSRDDGKSWDEIAAPTYPPKPEAVEDLDPMRNEPIPWSLKLIWAMAGGHPDAPQALWCGTMPGGLFRSDDSGDSWTIVESLWAHPGRKKWFGGGADYPGIHSILVDPRDPGHVTVAVSCGGIWTTFDDGAHWESRGQGMRADYLPPEQSGDPGIQDPHRVVQCLSQPDVYWAQHHNGIYKSVDAGKSWSEIENVEPSAFGFGVAVHPENPDIAWFVPAAKDEERCPVDGRLVVTRTRDGGRSFDVLRDGLPQENAYDIVFRHALDVDHSGDRLAFGSTTGSLWLSEDGGEQWQHVAAHLPPVYCVVFAALD